VKQRLAGRLHLSTLVAASGCVLLAVVAVGVLTAGGSVRRPPPPAKSFAIGGVTDPAGPVSLASYAGKPVIINFFASWCAPCQQETPLLARFYRSHHGKVIVIGIDANDQRGKALSFLRAHGVSYPVGSDPAATVAMSYGVAALPQTFFLDAGHRIVRHVVGALTQSELNSWAASLPHQNGTG
jgi:cytochrome c biogenesis protein CcmG/thiol:disulfide interchange protein DsbE